MCDHENRERAMATISRDESGSPTVWCDPCIAPLVAALNAADTPTIASCCGHDHRPGSITLADGRQLLIMDEYWSELLSGIIHELVGCKPGRECLQCASGGA